MNHVKSQLVRSEYFAYFSSISSLEYSQEVETMIRSHKKSYLVLLLSPKSFYFGLAPGECYPTIIDMVPL